MAAARIIIDETPAGQPKPSREEAQQIAREFLSTVADGEALAALMQSAAQSNPDATAIKPEELATIKIPVLVVYGRQEVGQTELARIKRFAQHSKAATHIIDGADHGNIDNREQFVALLQHHLQSGPSGVAGQPSGKARP